ncbi:MAG: hypothetical protein QOJ56_3927, partial [Mycobacterium sp.]|nr:hypothetical protein [Mycobacterium sp.]
MDPALGRLIRDGDASDEVAVMVRLAVPTSDLPDRVRVVASFGDVATIRAARGTLQELREHAVIRSVKAPVLFRADTVEQFSEDDLDPSSAELAAQRELRRPAGVELTGRGVVVGVVDWGLDFCHPAFLNADGTTRLLALWDQQPGPDLAHPNQYGYGRIHHRSEINDALRHIDPEAMLGYRPWLSDPGGGTHGTATTSIAAGSDWPGGVPGVAPEADIVFVHASTWGPAGPQGLGDSVALAEALDFIRGVAADRPCVTNLSLGGHGGPHDGCTLLEQAMDAFVLERPGRMIAQSCGNYFATNTHTEGELLAGEQALLPFVVNDEMPEFHEVDIWYSGADRMTIGVIGPGGQPRVLTRPGEHRDLTVDGVRIGEIRHRVDEPNDRRNNAVIRLDPSALSGTWQAVLQSADVVDGRFHAWIERESARPHKQTRFSTDIAVASTTTGTICNGYRTLSVGAYDPHDPDRTVSVFSSSGPTIDGRHKPDLLAPGARIIVARSHRVGVERHSSRVLSTVMSGTSMAAPHVTGAVACLFEHQRLPTALLRAALLESCDPYRGDEPARAGNGYLNLASAVESLTAPTPVGRERRRAELERHRKSATNSLPPMRLGEAIGEGNRAMTEQDVRLDDTAGARDAGQSGFALDRPIKRPWTVRELVTAFVLDRDPALQERLSEAFELLYGPYWRGVHALQRGDLLVRSTAGEGQRAMVVLLVDGELCERREAQRRGWELEGALPGRYALVTDESPIGLVEYRFGRRITDELGDMPAGQAIVRSPRRRISFVYRSVGESLAEDEPASVSLRSRRFSGDGDLAAVSAGRLRLGAPGTAPVPAPVLSSGPAVAKVQQALIDVGFPLPQFGADGTFAGETGVAVSKFKTSRNIHPADPVVGRATITALDTELLAHERSNPSPQPDPQPASAIADWFLTGQEIEPYRTPAYTTRNQAVPLREGDQYFEGLLKELENTEPGMRVLMAGWRFTPGQRLTPLTSRQTITDMLQIAAKRGGNVRVLAYGSKFATSAVPIQIPGLPSKDNAVFAKTLRASGIEAVLDSRLAPDFGSQHQKAVVVARPNADGSVAYVGGIDFCVDRYDKPRHVFLPERQIEPPVLIPIPRVGLVIPKKVNTDGWHDVQMEVRGPAVAHIWQALAERWNDPAPVAGPAGRPIDPSETPRPAATVGTMAVQVLRTVPCNGVFRLRPGGERTVLAAYRKAIRRAKHFIY